ncbi:hypothetical protein [Leptothrix cholodnii]|nr:hypothetical protein [Leptothrix cholodnii]
MRRTLKPRLLPLAAILSLLTLSALSAPLAAAEVQTVCTVTVNSADEKEAFRRHLPEARFRFVELVERGRPDWLASACRADVQCDVLIVSGHYDGSSQFFSDQLDTGEHLPVAELERISCSQSCPALFSQLKEVYLFGCNTLNPKPLGSTSAEIVRALVREGHSRAEAERELASLNTGLGNSSRDRMRHVFKDVPVIYGFSSTAPLGPLAGATLDRYLQANGGREIGRGHPSGSLLGYFAPYPMAVAHGITDQDPHADARRDMCQFADERSSIASKLAFVRRLLRSGTAATLLHLDRIEQLMTALDEPARQAPETALALDRIAQDIVASGHFLAFARQTDQPEMRVRMVDVARELGWLSADERREEFVRMLRELQARPAVGLTEVNLACTLNRRHELDGAFSRRLPADDMPHAAVRACLGSAEDHARTLAGLVGGNEADALIAQAYLRHRPLTDPVALQGLAAEIVRMDAPVAQVRALEALGRHHVADRGIVDLLVELYARTPSEPVQDAVAGILIRADRASIASPQLVRTLREHRLESPADDTLIDALIRRLESP